LKHIFVVKNPKLERNVFGLNFTNPVGLAAGFDKNAEVYREFANFGFGFIEIGTVTPKAQPGNPKPRSFRLKKDTALINRMGFNNLGVDEAVKRLKNRKSNVIIGGNIGKNTATPNESAVNDYLYCFERLYDYVDYFVVNVSCPNITNLHELADRDNLLEILGCLANARKQKEKYKPILLKIAPDLNLNQVDDVIDVIKITGTDGIVATNTSISRDGLVTPEDNVNEIGRGGLSGKPIAQKSTRIIRYIHEKTNGNIPIIGVGGVITPEDALEKLEAGASLVQVYTGFIYSGPAIVKKINQKILALK
jgi:dihydroorotate dehydrogenase